MYKLKFNDFELSKFNQIENEKIRKSLMSIYMYLLKINDHKNQKNIEAGIEHKKDIYLLKISFRKFLKAYCRHHEKISIYTLKNRIDMLLDLGLILIEKVKNSFLYSFIRYIPNKKANKKTNKENTSESAENTSLNNECEKPKSINLEKNNNNYINNSVPHASEKPVFVSCFKEIKNTVDTYIEKFSIKSDSGIKEVYRRLNKAIKRGTLRMSGFEKYIRLTINSIRDYFIPQLVRQANMKDSNKTIHSTNVKQGSFNDYTQRNYNYDKLENLLLGWDNDTSLEDCYTNDDTGQASKTEKPMNPLYARLL